ncbi:MAG: ribokinase [Pseudomonadota bacterium]
MIINIGSINIDHVYKVINLPKPGETTASIGYETFLGGKGVNQSVAIARASGKVRHVGAVGHDGDWALRQMEALGVSTADIAMLPTATGHAVIALDQAGENQILIEAGANQKLTESQITRAFTQHKSNADWVLLQNETNLAEFIVREAKAFGYKVAYAAAPFVADVTIKLLPHIDLLAVNEVEASALAGELGGLLEEISVPMVLVTLGSKGSVVYAGDDVIGQDAFSVDVVDTVGAGDTFLGSFLARFANNQSLKASLRYAAAASALQITKFGAATTIPERAEVDAFLEREQ